MSARGAVTTASARGSAEKRGMSAPYPAGAPSMPRTGMGGATAPSPARQRSEVAPPGQSVGSAVVVLALVGSADARQDEDLGRPQVPVDRAEPGAAYAEGARRLV